MPLSPRVHKLLSDQVEGGAGAARAALEGAGVESVGKAESGRDGLEGLAESQKHGQGHGTPALSSQLLR